MEKKKPKATLRTVSAEGSHREVGVEIGEQCRDIARRMVRETKAYYRDMHGTTPSRMLANARKVLPATRKYAPGAVEELEGYAEGAGLEFDEVFASLCDHGWNGRGCTDIAVSDRWTKDDCVYAAHNEDVEPGNIRNVVLARVEPDDEPGYIAMSYGGIAPTVGLNAAGISLTGNAVEPTDVRPGIPKMLIARHILSADGLYAALKASMPVGRGHSFNNIVCDLNGEIYSMEGSATAFDPIYAEDGYLVHTNHYLSPRMWEFEADMHTRFSSIIRYNRARRLFRDELGEVSVGTFKRVLSDHVGFPESICRHPDQNLCEHDQAMTIFSSVIDLTDKVMWVCYGNPCEGEYVRHEL